MLYNILNILCIYFEGKMEKYWEINVVDKLTRLINGTTSAALSYSLGVHRNTLMNWRDGATTPNADKMLDLDVLYCRRFVIPELDKPDHKPKLTPDNYRFTPEMISSIAFGTLEVEEDMSFEDFQRFAFQAAEQKALGDRDNILKSANTYAATLWCLNNHDELISPMLIRMLHGMFMNGLRNDAGQWSQKIRVMGKLEGVSCTDPEDIPEEIAGWCERYKSPKTMLDIAKAHAHFILIHPFGDGNGRVGRALLQMAIAKQGWVIPTINKRNQALYYACMEHAMRHGRHNPLAHLLCDRDSLT